MYYIALNTGPLSHCRFFSTEKIVLILKRKAMETKWRKEKCITFLLSKTDL